MAKPYRRLKPADLAAAPIWEWVPDEDADDMDEDDDAGDALVQPTTYASIPVSIFAQFIVSAAIELNIGQVFPGIAEVTVADGEAVLRPAEVFLIDRQLKIPGMEANRLLTRYTKSPEVYPTAVTLNVLIEGEDMRRREAIRGGDMRDLMATATDMMSWLRSLRGKSSN